MFSRKGSWDLLGRRHLAGYYHKMLGLISRQAPRLLRQPGSLIFRRCLADGAPAVALTFGSPSEVSYEAYTRNRVQLSRATTR